MPNPNNKDPLVPQQDNSVFDSLPLRNPRPFDKFAPSASVEERCEHGFTKCAICESAPWAIKLREARSSTRASVPAVPVGEDSGSTKDTDEPHRWTIEPHQALAIILEVAEMYLWDGNEGEERVLKVRLNKDILATPAPKCVKRCGHELLPDVPLDELGRCRVLIMGMYEDSRECGCKCEFSVPAALHCSCGSACTPDEYQQHVAMGHDQPKVR